VFLFTCCAISVADEPKAASKPAAAKPAGATAGLPSSASNTAGPSTAGQASSGTQSKPKTKPAAAKKKPAGKAALPEVEPPAPFIDFLYPAGGQRGKTVETTATGANLKGSSAASMSGPGVKVKIVEVVNPTTVRLSVAIAPDAELGERDVRLTTPGGVSNRFRFFVGELPEINEIEPNSTPAQAQRLKSLPIVVNGQIFEADRDFFRFTAKAGQTLVCAAEARAILPFMADAVPGWCDACLTLRDANGKELAYVDDFHLKPDPVLIYTVAKDGDYLLEIRDILYRGRGNFVYRLKIGELPYITGIYPLGGRRGSTSAVQLQGVNLPTKCMSIAIPADSPAVRSVQVSSGGIFSNAVDFAVGDAPEVQQAGPNDTIAKAMRVHTPITINGRIERPGDLDYYVFHAKAKERLVMEVHARRLDSPLDSIITLFGPKGQELAENDDTVDPRAALATFHADSRLVYTFPAAGDYVLRIADVQGNGGPDYAYRLAIGPPHPDYALRITPDNLRVGQGESTVVKVYAVRLDGLGSEIRLAVRNLPPGFVASQARVAAGQEQSVFTITAPRDIPLGVFSPKIVGTASVGNGAKEPIVRTAVPAETMMQAFAFQHNVPTKEFSLALVKPSSFNLLVNRPAGEVLEVAQGGTVQIPVKVYRKEGLKIGLVLGQEGRAQGITVKGMYLPPEKGDATIALSAGPQAPVGLVQNVILSATFKATQKQAIGRVAPAILVKIIAGTAAKAPPAPAAPAAKKPPKA
jgi:hypothetical protein